MATILTSEALYRLNDEMGKESLPNGDEVIAKIGSDTWRSATNQGGKGLTLDEFERFAADAAAAFKLGLAPNRSIRFSSVVECEIRLRDLVDAAQTQPGLYVVLNLDQGALFHDQPAGHFVIVAGRCDRRLAIVDGDATWYPPYWADLGAACAATMTTDSETGKVRGLIVLRFDRH